MIGNVARPTGMSNISTALMLPFLLRILLFALPLQAPVPPRLCAGVDSTGALQRWDPGYAEARRFADFLTAHGLPPRCVTRSVLQGLLGEMKAAGFQTDSGPVAVVFFPEPAGAESVHVVERRRGAGYRYTFTTRQPGLLPRTTWDIDTPARLVARGTWFIAVWEDRTEAWLKAALGAPRN